MLDKVLDQSNLETLTVPIRQIELTFQIILGRLENNNPSKPGMIEARVQELGPQPSTVSHGTSSDAVRIANNFCARNDDKNHNSGMLLNVSDSIVSKSAKLVLKEVDKTAS